jgi:hypothetical protein
MEATAVSATQHFRYEGHRTPLAAELATSKRRKSTWKLELQQIPPRSRTTPDGNTASCLAKTTTAVRYQRTHSRLLDHLTVAAESRQTRNRRRV